jgi:hypothetical protein
VYQLLGQENIKKLQNRKSTRAKAGKSIPQATENNFIPSLSLLYPANNYTTGSRRVYEYEFII